MVSGGGIASDFAPVFHLLEDKWEGKPEAEDDLQLIINLEVNFVAPVLMPQVAENFTPLEGFSLTRR